MIKTVIVSNVEPAIAVGNDACALAPFFPVFGGEVGDEGSSMAFTTR
jgi:hypothetical protein